MKIKATFCALVGLTASSFGTIVNVGNLAGTNPAVDLPVFDNAGNLVAAGDLTITAGIFSGAANAELEGFTQFGTDSFTNTFNGSFFNGTFNLPSAEAGAFIGNQIFIVLTSGEEIAVFESAVTVNPDAAGLEGSTAVNVSATTGTVVVGTLESDGGFSVNIPGPGDVAFTNRIVLAAIPEPSAFALLVIGGLGFISRRRR